MLSIGMSINKVRTVYAITLLLIPLNKAGAGLHGKNKTTYKKINEKITTKHKIMKLIIANLLNFFCC
jgi:hypothetical protein